MSTILKQPDAFSFSGNIKPFMISSSTEVVFEVCLATTSGRTIVLSEKFQPGADNLVTISLNGIVDLLLDVTVPNNLDIVNEQPLAVGNFFTMVDGVASTLKYANLTSDKRFSINTSWSVVSAWLLAAGQSSQVIAWDVSYVDAGGIQKIAAQRYQLRNRAEEENGFLWSNTLGGIDTISFSGSREEDKKLEYKMPYTQMMR